MTADMTCIICKKKKIKFSIEHFIPNCLVGKPSRDVTIPNAICNTCNSILGRTVDAAFINTNVIRLVRLRNRAFLPEEKVPYLVTRNAKNLIDQDGNAISLDAVVDTSGSRYQPSLKPNEQQQDSSTVFVRTYREAEELVKKIEGKIIRYEIEPLLPKKALHSAVDIMIEKNPPLEILYKMFLDFIYMQYGRDKALDPMYDPIRNVLLNTDLRLSDEYKYKTIVHFPIDLVIHEKKGNDLVSHRIGIDFDSRFWHFYFAVFEDVTFCCTIPAAIWYDKREYKVDLLKY